ATVHGYSRTDVDAYAVESQRRAAAAWSEGRFARSVVPVRDDNDIVILDRDEYLRPQTTMQTLGALEPSFAVQGEQFGFDAVVLRFMEALGVGHDKVNVNGGAIALGHPLGASGAMLLGTLVDELERRDLTTGVVTLCVGAGMGTAMIVERV